MAKYRKFKWMMLVVATGLLLSCSSAPKDSGAPESASAEIAEEADFDEDSFEDEGEGDEEFSDEEVAQEDFSEDEFLEEEFSDEEFDEDDIELSADADESDADDSFAEESSDELAGDFEEETSDSENISDGAFQEELTVEEPSAVAVSEPSGVFENEVIGLDFLANKNGGTIMISTNGPTKVRQRKNLATGQYIVEVDNIMLPEKYQRPYDTREFGGAIGLFQAYQEPGSSTARFIVQLNGDVEPLISTEGNSIMVLASNQPEIQIADMAPEDQAAAVEEEERNASVDMEKIKRDENLLGKKSIEDFLIGNTNYYGKKINIELVNTDILRVFDIIAEQSNLNIVVSEDVKGSITLKLREIPWDQALMVVLQSKQLGYVKNGNILRIAPLKTIEKESEEARKVIEAQLRLQPVKVKIFPVSFAQAEEMAGQVGSFLTEGRGTVKADARTNSLVVTDVVEVLDKVGKLIKNLDTETPQVLMEAKFVEATEEFSRDVNLNIVSNLRTKGDNSTRFTGPDGSAESVLGGLFTTFSASEAFGDLTAKLDLYEKRNLAKVISSPRVVGLNNETAKITQTNQVLNVSITGAATEDSVPTTTVTPLDIKTDLTITPQITANGSVLMDMTITRDVAGEKQEFSGASSTPINTRSAKTKVLVPNGDTVVIGGVYSFDKSRLKTSNPYLSDIPIIGTLFKDETSSYNKSELMIFVTPRVLNIEKAFNQGGSLGVGDEGNGNAIF